MQKISQEQKTQLGFYSKLNKRNAKNGRNLLLFAAVAEIALIIFTLARANVAENSTKLRAYMAMYMLLFSLALGLFFFLRYAINIKLYQKSWFGSVTVLTCLLIVLWGAAFSTLDMYFGKHTSTIVFLTILFSVSGTIYLNPKIFIALIGTVVVAFIFANYFINNNVNSGFLINHIIFSLVAMLFCALRYRDFLREFEREKNYLEINNRLIAMNESQQNTNEMLKKVSRTDALTGIYNRWGLNFVFEQKIQECKKNKLPLTIMLFDVDNFKSINDTFGHKAGDESLVKISRVFTEIAGFERVFRYGGEEFIVLLQNKNKESAYTLADTICKEVAKCKIGERSLSISGGVYTKIPDIASDLDEYLTGADKALYLAKEQGKNRVIAN